MMIMKKRLVALSTFIAAGVAGASLAHAAGFALEEHSVAAMGAAYSGASTNTNDASVIYYNPAGMTGLSGPEVSLDAVGLAAQNKLVDHGTTLGGAPTGGGTSNNPLIDSVIPSGYFATPVYDNRFWLGLAVTTPFGLSSDYKDGWFGRYDAIKSYLRTVDVQPTAAVKVTDWLSLGAGVDYQHAKADLTAAVTNGIQTGSSELKGSDSAWGWTAGATITPMPGTKIALDYRSEINYSLGGHVAVTGLTLGGDLDDAAHAGLDLPQQASVGLSQKLTNQWTGMAQVTWTGWDNFHDITATADNGGATLSSTPENYRNTWTGSIGAQYAWNKNWTFRGGYQFDETPTHEPYRDTRVPDGNRNWLTLGTTYAFNDHLSVDAAGALIHLNNANIDVTHTAGAASTTVDAESKDGYIELLGLGLNYKF